MYSVLFSLLKKMDPESAHHLGMVVLRLAGLPGVRLLLRRLTTSVQAPPVDAMGLHFPNPLGIAAGFDKNAQVVTGLWALGFGHVEVGTVTPRPQAGNPRPRLFRLPKDRALLNRMGFNNDGAVVVAARLGRLRQRAERPVIGVNIGKNRDTPLEQAVQDYREAARLLAPVSDYLVVNVSSPNTPGLRSLLDPTELVRILKAVTAEADGIPVMVKISPDSPDGDIRAICEVVNRLDLAGVIATNTTVSREGLATASTVVDSLGPGGISGLPLQSRAHEVTHLCREVLGPQRCVVSVGGVESGFDLRRRRQAGATLVQVYTTFIYRGPLVARHIFTELQSIRG